MARGYSRCGICLLLSCLSATAELRRIELVSRKDFGSYERIIGKAFFAANPKLRANAIVTDIGLAPKNEKGEVEYSGDLVLYRPKQSRGAVFLEVVNRGMPTVLGLLQNASRRGNAPEQWDLGDAFLLKQGFTLAFLGWQFDLRTSDGLTFQTPSADVRGPVRANAVDSGNRAPIMRFPLQYCAENPQQETAVLTFRSKFADDGAPIPRQTWSFDAKGCSVNLSKPEKRGPGLYEVVYTAKGSPIAGLGLAAMRDLASYLKYGGPVETLRENPAEFRRVIAYGYSQSARFLRQFLRDGFNADEKGRQAFDAMLLSSAGAGVGGFNHRFAYPGNAGNSVLSVHRPVDIPPFDDAALLASCDRAKVTPYIFTTSSSTEYWARAASLIHTSNGTSDTPVAPRSRMYLLTGTSHSRGIFPPARGARGSGFQHFTNFAEQGWVTRALIVDLDQWVAEGKQPPPSAYPHLAKKQLVPRTEVNFPKFAAMPFPDYMPHVWRVDYGPDFARKGIIGHEPPRVGSSYPILVPQVDADGNDLGGIPLPETAAPLGTFTGWNISVPQMRDLNFLGGLIGSFLPFAKTKADREASGDPRLSIAERYDTRDAYLSKVRAAADDLIKHRLLLAEDAPSVMSRAKAMWAEIVER